MIITKSNVHSVGMKGHPAIYVERSEWYNPAQRLRLQRMKENVLNNFLAIRFQSVERNLFAYEKTSNPVCLHRLRVDIKRIRAILAFAEKVYQKKFLVSSLHPLFRKAGEIREIQINLHLLNTL